MGIRKSPFFIRLFHWEYWPFGIIQLPLFFLWIWYAIKERSLFYFSASNPSISTGGMMGESKYEVLKLLPGQVKPVTIFIKHNTTPDHLLERMREADLTFPVVFKPDLGERGWKVSVIRHVDEAKQYLAESHCDFIAQEWIDLPLEFGVFYVRFPHAPTGEVTSVTGKAFLSVTGDGKSTLKELVYANSRARLQARRLKEMYAKWWNEVIANEYHFALGEIGNHCLGTSFINRNDLIGEALNKSFSAISKDVKGFYFGRYDIRCTSEADLINGKVMVMELNGCGAEPSHIYHPGYPLLKAMGDLIKHWKTMYRVSVANHRAGVPYLPFGDGIKIYKSFKRTIAS